MKYDKIKSNATTLELKDGEIGNRAWFALKYIEENNSGRDMSYIQSTEAFKGIEVAVQIGNCKMHYICDYDIYAANVDRLNNVPRSRPSKNSTASRLEKLERDYSALAGKLGSYQRQITILSRKLAEVA